MCLSAFSKYNCCKPKAVSFRGIDIADACVGACFCAVVGAGVGVDIIVAAGVNQGTDGNRGARVDLGAGFADTGDAVCAGFANAAAGVVDVGAGAIVGVGVVDASAGVVDAGPGIGVDAVDFDVCTFSFYTELTDSGRKFLKNAGADENVST